MFLYLGLVIYKVLLPIYKNYFFNVLQGLVFVLRVYVFSQEF